ncbi:MAG TPA: hypothetical protein VIK42_00375 [Bacteroidales bacterium]
MKQIYLSVVLAILSIAGVKAQHIDELQFGNTGSEQSHGLTSMRRFILTRSTKRCM